MTKQQQQAEALRRAENGQSVANEIAIIQHYAALGIAAQPRVDVFTYSAWKAKGRQVKRGETGCKVQTWIPVEKDGKPDGMRPKRATVFHSSQTKAIGEDEAAIFAKTHPAPVKTQAHHPPPSRPADPNGGVVGANPDDEDPGRCHDDDGGFCENRLF